MTTRKERIAANEAQFRDVNEKLGDATFDNPQFFCECSDLECVEFVRMEHAEYEAIHADPMQFVVKPGHEELEAETIVSERDGFNIVRKDEDVRHIVDDEMRG